MGDDRAYNAALLAAAEREQRRLAEDLHNTLCQNLVGVSLLVKLVIRRIEAGKEVPASDLQKISAYVDDAIEHSRAPLRAQMVSQSETGLVKALAELAALSGKGLPCRLEVRPGNQDS